MKRLTASFWLVIICVAAAITATITRPSITLAASITGMSPITYADKQVDLPSANTTDAALLKLLTEKKQQELTTTKQDDDFFKHTDGAYKNRVIKRPEGPSSLERSFARKSITLQDKQEAQSFSREFRQFGYDFFSNSTQLDAVMGSLPVGDDYQIGPGDRMVLSVWGAFDGRFELLVDRNGGVTIPKAGNVNIWGMSLAAAREAVDKALGRYFKNYQMTLTMARLRTIQVFVVGEVETPGSYQISSLASVVNALGAAGGPSRGGSLRKIRITRDSKIIAEVDLYDLFLNGDRSKDLRLQNGDTVFVPVIGPVVAVAGEVKRPAIYEMNGAMTLSQVLKMAGGITASGYTGRMQLERLVENRARIVQDIHLDHADLDATLSKVVMQDRDMVKVSQVPAATRQIITLKGNVFNSGEFEFKPGMKLTDLIPSTQLLMPESFLDSVEILRLSPPDYRKQIMTANLRKALAGDDKENILLQEQDTVTIFSRWDMEVKPTVQIYGAVARPGSYDYRDGMKVRDLVTASGSTLRRAFFDEAELSRIVVSADKAEMSRLRLDLGKAMAGDPLHNLSLQPDDTLNIRGVREWSEASNNIVNLFGEVKFPGGYAIAKGERLSSVIMRAGGFTEKAYLRGAKFLRYSLQASQQKQLEEVIARTEKDVLQKQAALASVAASKEELEATKASLESVLKGLEHMKKMKAEGRIIVKLKPLEELQNSDFDLALEGGDTINIPARPSTVSVMGQVYNPISTVYRPESSFVDDCLKLAGGIMNDADSSEMYVLRADGTVFSRQQSTFGFHWSDDSKRWTFGSFLSSALEPGDTLVVPQRIERVAWLREIKDITTIMSQIALTAGTVLIGLK